MFCSNSEAATLARILISGYPNSSASDAQGYAAQLVTVFTGFDVGLIRKAVSPSGIPLDHPEFMPSIGSINQWLNKKQEHFSMISRRIAPPEEQLGGWVGSVPTPRLKKMGEDWLSRRDPIAQQLTGQKRKEELSEDEKREIMQNARKAADDLLTMKLGFEAGP